MYQSNFSLGIVQIILTAKGPVLKANKEFNWLAYNVLQNDIDKVKTDTIFFLQQTLNFFDYIKSSSRHLRLESLYIVENVCFLLYKSFYYPF